MKNREPPVSWSQRLLGALCIGWLVAIPGGCAVTMLGGPGWPVLASAVLLLAMIAVGVYQKLRSTIWKECPTSSAFPPVPLLFDDSVCACAYIPNLRQASLLLNERCPAKPLDSEGWVIWSGVLTGTAAIPAMMLLLPFDRGSSEWLVILATAAAVVAGFGGAWLCAVYRDQFCDRPYRLQKRRIWRKWVQATHDCKHSDRDGAELVARWLVWRHGGGPEEALRHKLPCAVKAFSPPACLLMRSRGSFAEPDSVHEEIEQLLVRVVTQEDPMKFRFGWHPTRYSHGETGSLLQIASTRASLLGDKDPAK